MPLCLSSSASDTLKLLPASDIHETRFVISCTASRLVCLSYEELCWPTLA